jgi:hypothetical protein
MFDLAAKLIWHGGEKVYEAGKRDIAKLYEYWLFFALYDLVKTKFNLTKYSNDEKEIPNLIEPTANGLNLMLKSGTHTALEGEYNSGTRNLNIKFSYNRSFKGGKEYNDKEEGSWTKALRPDYTLSFWPSELKEKEAEEKELIVHIHFDSKYKVDQFIIEKDIAKDGTEYEDNLEEEKEEERKGIYKNADLLKMHAYKDAIRRTGGAYILYPGSIKQDVAFRGFHEIIPGLGAFAIRPEDEKTENGINNLSLFIDKVINHFLDRASQRENTAVKIYDIHKTKKEDDDILKEPMPEFIAGEKLIPDETFVLIGYCKEEENLPWYKEKGIYNFRMDDDKGSLILEKEVVNAKYLLLRMAGEDSANKFFRIKSKGPKVLQGKNLEGYISDKIKEYYLVIEIENEECLDFKGASFEFKKLEKYKLIPEDKYRKPGMPFAVSLSDLMKVKVKK